MFWFLILPHLNVPLLLRFLDHVCQLFLSLQENKPLFTPRRSAADILSAFSALSWIFFLGELNACRTNRLSVSLSRKKTNEKQDAVSIHSISTDVYFTSLAHVRHY